jgi:beta-galactosidase
MTRREWLKLTSAAGGAALLPNVTGILGGASAQSGPPAGRERLLADFGWRFHLGHADDIAKDFGYGRGGAFAKSGSLIGGRGSVTQATFDDAAWQAVDLPHDWAIDLPFNDDRGLNGHGAKPLGRAFPETSIGWYRRTFDIPASDAGRRIAIEFDGVFRDCIVILNGHFVGRNLSGYVPFRFDITDLVTYGGRNALVVRVDATEYEGWFYEGAGIYRHVWVEKTASLHVAHWGTFVTSEVGPESAIVSIATEVQNDADAAASCRVVSRIVDTSGTTVATLSSTPVSVAAWSRQTVTQKTALARPKLWSIEDPHLYKLVTEIQPGSTGPSGSVDTYETPFGVRVVKFDADNGFFLNGKPVKLKGTCNHQDHAGVGAGLPDRLQYFRIEKLKEMGSNAYRTSHNPPTPELLDACDRLGMLVLDETRMMDSNAEGLSQLERLIRRDRNHPSVFCWSIGNEEPEQGTERGARVAATMKRLARDLDPTRLVTEAMNNAWGRGLSAVVDVQGFNYRGGAQAADFAKALDDYHRAHPAQPTMGTEVASTVSTRGIYANDEARGYVSAYDRNFPPWASTAEEWWTIYNSRPWVAGGFVWTGFDYRGEPTPYNWPCISSHFGIIDMCGFPKDLFYYYQAWWSDKPVLHLFPHWNWAGKEGQEIEVWCFTNLDAVELFVNGTTAGLQMVKRDSHVAWKVPYAPGAIEARGFRGDARSFVSSARQPTPVLVDRRETTGPPARIVLAPDRTRISADGEDLSVVVAQIVDAQGRIVPTAGDEVTFTASGPGRVIGVGNGDPSSHEPDRASKRSAFNGLCMALVQSLKTQGEIRVEASALNLASAAAGIATSATTPRPAL